MVQSLTNAPLICRVVSVPGSWVPSPTDTESHQEQPWGLQRARIRNEPRAGILRTVETPELAVDEMILQVPAAPNLCWSKKRRTAPRHFWSGSTGFWLKRAQWQWVRPLLHT
ncbi:hypothetical protein VFPPC_17676 [Pochonia chlamydosporia 170]|uniref:Uncharacterized protein n=1 Tax=Pochonia chlamydosporia 170 TaxID=1380566 RepID=A0A219AQT6_METCM|nr:hypothetical protein VFPPC_17676 [Pochonia chlamydosporia 170]OWT43148.1 hypothetical protein VFPPC_17676 [Pochonia chlamydosporia 170]